MDPAHMSPLAHLNCLVCANYRSIRPDGTIWALPVTSGFAGNEKGPMRNR